MKFALRALSQPTISIFESPFSRKILDNGYFITNTISRGYRLPVRSYGCKGKVESLFSSKLIPDSGCWQDHFKVGDLFGNDTEIGSSSIVDSLESMSANASELVGIAYFYCDGNSPEKQNALIIFGSCLKQLTVQLLASKISPGQLVKQRFKENLRQSKEFFERNITWIFRFFEEVYIVIDGLDECSDRAMTISMLPTLSMKNTHVLVTSRPEVDIAKAFHGLKTMNIDESVQCDITTHVKWQFETDDKLRLIRPSLKLEIQETLLARCDGM